MKPSNKLLNKFCAIQYNHAPEGTLSIQLIRIDEKDFHKFFTRDSRKEDVFHDGIKILEVYEDNPSDYKEYEKLYVKFIKSYYPVHPEKEPCQTDGWISPDGKLYGCSHAGHWQLASDLLANIYKIDGYYPILHQKGWVKVYRDGEVSLSVDKITKKQFDYLTEMSKVGGVVWKRNLTKFLDKIKFA